MWNLITHSTSSSNQNYLKFKKGAALKHFLYKFGDRYHKKNYFFCSYFRHISLCFYSNFDRESLLDAELDSASNMYPPGILLTGPATPKTRNTWKTWWWCHHHVFSGISCFWGSGVRQKYAVWVHVGCGIKFRIQRALSIEIWVKTQWDMSKIRTKKVVFSFLPPKLINIILLF